MRRRITALGERAQGSHHEENRTLITHRMEYGIMKKKHLGHSICDESLTIRQVHGIYTTNAKQKTGGASSTLKKKKKYTVSKKRHCVVFLFLS
jgi:hypothetical protein